MKPCLVLAGLLGAVAVWGQGVTLRASAELTLDAPWSLPVDLEFPQEGRYRLEAMGLGGEPVEVVVQRRVAGGTWLVEATNKSLRGVVEAVVEWSVDGDQWRVLPPWPVAKTVILRLRKVAFSSLKDALKRDLTPGPEQTLPLRKRLDLPRGTGGPGLVATTGPRGQLWMAWLIAQGTAAEVWDAGPQRLGSPLAVTKSGPWERLELEGTERPVLTASRPGEVETRAWTGLDWTVEAAPAAKLLTTAQGSFRYENTPIPRVWRRTNGGWADLELPQNRMMDRMILGSTADGLYVLLASSTGRERSFSLWKPSEGWTALPPPPAAAPPRADLWAATNGAGSLFHLEGEGNELWLRQFDGQEWKPGLDLSSLAGGLVAAVLLAPSAWSKTGTLVVATDRVSVYDLP